MVWPSDRMMILLNWFSTSAEGWWIVARIDIPLFASYLNILEIYSAVCESRPEVGSSRISKLGFVISSYPIEVLFLSPPDSPFLMTFPIGTFLQPKSRSLFNMDWILISCSFRVIPLVVSYTANLKHSSGVIVSINTSSCWTKAPYLPKTLESTPTLLTCRSPVNSDPLLRTSLPASTFSSEVFPLPLGPMIATDSPGIMYPNWSLRMCLKVLPFLFYTVLWILSSPLFNLSKSSTCTSISVFCAFTGA